MRTNTERVPVVTAFVYRDGKIALIKRSDKVGTYKEHWAAFSGYVERLPLNQARTELEEEAGVTWKEARLNGIGIPMHVDDGKDGHKWLVFPFLFKLTNGIEIKTDWETAEWGWFAPEEVKNLKTVPGLDKALAIVWPPFGDGKFWEGLSEVAVNTRLGATDLACRGLIALGGYVEVNKHRLNHEELIRAIRAFAASRSVMGAFPDLAARLLLAIEREGGQFDFDELVTELLGAIEDATTLSAKAAADGLRGKRRLFTLSYSKAVRDAIIEWHTDESEVIVAESGPLNEGILLAEYLNEHGVNTRTVPDSEIGKAVRQVDAVLVGCDGITGDNQLLNKIGTQKAVNKAIEAGTPAYAAAQSFKIMPSEWPVFIETQSPADFHESKESQAGIKVFDLTPLDKFEAVFTDEGPLTTTRLSEVRAELDSVELIPVV